MKTYGYQMPYPWRWSERARVGAAIARASDERQFQITTPRHDSNWPGAIIEGAILVAIVLGVMVAL